MPTPKRIVIYTDGSAHKQIGGWSAVIIQDTGISIMLSGGEVGTTSNVMELTAIYEAMLWLKSNGSPRAQICSDSQYALNCMWQWAACWERRGWTKKGGPIKNLDLIQRMFALSKQLDVRWKWVKGHAGDPCNELADRLAEKARMEITQTK